MSESWPRHHVIKFAGTVLDGIKESAYGLLDCLARVENKARETVVALLEDEENKETAGTREADGGGEAQAEELGRVWTELAVLQEMIGHLIETSPPAQKPVGSCSPVAPG